MPIDRQTALRHLIEYRLPLEPALAVLSNCGWDSQEPVAWLSANDVMAVLARYVAGEITAEQLTDWADLIECREDIGINEHEKLICDVVFRLANPNLNEEVTLELISTIQEEIRHAQSSA